METAGILLIVFVVALVLKRVSDERSERKEQRRREQEMVDQRFRDKPDIMEVIRK